MDSLMLRDEARVSRVRQAEEFLDPRTSWSGSQGRCRCPCRPSRLVS